MIESLHGMTFAYFGMLVGVASGVMVAAYMARRWELLLDRSGAHPTNGGSPTRRKSHERETPLVGGLVLLVALSVAMLLMPFPWGSAWCLPFGLAALGVMGLMDDIYNLRAATRLLIQFVVVFVVVVIGGLEIQTLGDLFGFGPIVLGPLSVPVTILCLMLIVNAVNMLDGIDGLAGSVALIASVAFAIVAFVEGQPALGMVSLLLSAGLIGFLFFNLRTPWRRRASVFLGDSGSMMLGFWMGWMAVALTQMPGSGLAPATVALFLVFPAADAFAVMIRRALRGRNPMHPDRGHAHHILLRAGCTVSRSVTILTLVYGLWVSFALLCHFSGCTGLVQFMFAALAFAGYISFVLNGYRFIRWCRRNRRNGRPTGVF